MIDPKTVIDLTAKVQPDGTLEWDVPAGDWTIVRTGYACNGDQTLVASPGAAGPSVDFLSKAATDFHFKNTAAILLQDAGPLAGKTLKYFHDDSWEAGLPNWTGTFLEDFKKYRGYDARPYLPVLAGHILTSVEATDRFLYDFRKTIGDCLAENHYARLAELAHAQGVQVHCEAGGPCCPKVPPMDALKNLGRLDIPMGEFWQSGNWKENGQNIAGKQTACAAHIYGKTFVAAEAFTKMGPHYEDGLADLKPTADKAFCEGTNRFFLHTWTSSRPEDGQPGFEYFAGTHFNRNVTWWLQAGAFFSYISRCQYLLQQGLFAADVCFYYGDQTPNFAEAKHVDPALGPGYDYDVCNAEVLLTRMQARDGRIVLPDGMNYRLLVLPDRRTMPVEVLRKIKSLVETGVTVVGPKPRRDPGLKNYPQCDAEVKELADEIWGDCDGQKVLEHCYGKGRIFWGKPLREILVADGVRPDFEYKGGNAKTFLDFIHRRSGETEIYFVCNRNGQSEQADATFRVSGKQPELWDAVTGEIRPAKAFRQEAGQTIVPLEFAPYGSCFVVFRKAIATATAGREPRTIRCGPRRALGGGWKVAFDPKWGGPGSAQFDQLVSWTTRAEPGIKYYSGKATYRKTFDVPEDLRKGGRLRLDFGVVKNVAEVRLNGRDLGVVWTDPFSVDITEAVKPAGNRLEVDVINLWTNRLIGDAGLPVEKRLAHSNVTMDRNAKLLNSGLLGPVTLQTTQYPKALTTIHPSIMEPLLATLLGDKPIVAPQLNPAVAKPVPAKIEIADGPFKPTFESLKQYKCPEWFRDAKLGIWAHWGPQAVPMNGDWYARAMYEQGSDHYNYHVAHYGHPSKFGYKDLVQLWKAENWDPDQLVGLYKKAGARYFVAQANHHDNWDNWNSKYHRWNSVNVGPKKDIVGLWRRQRASTDCASASRNTWLAATVGSTPTRAAIRRARWPACRMTATIPSFKTSTFRLTKTHPTPTRQTHRSGGHASGSGACGI